MSTINQSRKAIIVTLMAAFIMGITGTAIAKDTHWQKNHPRREQVNGRLNNQNKRIKQEVKAGEITKAQAKGLHKQDRQIRQEERSMASRNGSHITKGEKKVLNQQENAVSKEIGK